MISSRYRFYVLISEQTTRQQIPKYLSESPEQKFLQNPYLEIATEEETSLLEAWKKYRVLLNRVNTTTAPDIEWPTVPIIE